MKKKYIILLQYNIPINHKFTIYKYILYILYTVSVVISKNSKLMYVFTRKIFFHQNGFFFKLNLNVCKNHLKNKILHYVVLKFKIMILVFDFYSVRI